MTIELSSTLYFSVRIFSLRAEVILRIGCTCYKYASVALAGLRQSDTHEMDSLFTNLTKAVYLSQLTSGINLTLPSKTHPKIYRLAHTDKAFDANLPVGLYTNVVISDESTQELVDALNRPLGFDLIKPIPVPNGVNFVNQPIEVAYTTHVEKFAGQTFFPTYFVAIDHEDWKQYGVIIVALSILRRYDPDEIESGESFRHFMANIDNWEVDHMRVAPEDAGIMVAGLSIGHGAWEEYKDDLEEANRYAAADDHDGKGRVGAEGEVQTEPRWRQRLKAARISETPS